MGVKRMHGVYKALIVGVFNSDQGYFGIAQNCVWSVYEKPVKRIQCGSKILYANVLVC